ncbi:hypothetical protein GmRootA79_13230 [Acidovorax sp. A79]
MGLTARARDEATRHSAYAGAMRKLWGASLALVPNRLNHAEPLWLANKSRTRPNTPRIQMVQTRQLPGRALQMTPHSRVQVDDPQGDPG